MKSNFSLLLELGEHRLFDVVHTAELMYVDAYYQYIPTALRVFIEGILIEVIAHRSINKEYVNLDSLIKLFEETENKPEVARAFRDIKRQGNNTSHYNSTKISAKDAKKLLITATKVALYFVKHYKKNSDADIRFYDAYLPEPKENGSDFEQLNSLLRNAENENTELTIKVKSLIKEKAALNIKLMVNFAENDNLDCQLDELKLRNADLVATIKNVDYCKRNESEIQKQVAQQFQTQIEIDKLKVNKKRLTDALATLKSEKADLALTEKQFAEGVLAAFLPDTCKNEDSLKSLDSNQTLLVNIDKGQHFLQAPPGAGKTEVVTQRVNLLLEKCKSDSDLICLTFTTRAAQEMRHRIEERIGNRSPFIGNFHNFCLDLLKQSQSNKVVNETTILDDLYRSELLNTALNLATNERDSTWDTESKVDKWLDNYLINLTTSNTKEINKNEKVHNTFLNAYLGLLLADLCSSDEGKTCAQGLLNNSIKGLYFAVDFHLFGNLDSNKRDHIDAGSMIINFIKLLFHTYRKLKKDADCVDFDDILGFGIQHLEISTHIYKYVQIDECQDLNLAQWLIVSLICDDNTHIFAVGDPQQAIYGFLGSNSALLKQKVKRFEHHSLIINYRSACEIIDLLNVYRESNWGLEPIETVRQPVNNYPTMLFSYPDNEVELNEIALATKKILSEPTRNIGILLANNNQCDSFASMLSHHNVDYFKVGKSDLMQRSIVRDWLSLVRIFTGNSSRTDWWRIAYRLSKNAGVKNLYTRTQAIELINRVFSLGIEPSMLQCGNTQQRAERESDSLFSYPLKYLFDAMNNKGLVIFDTETTGLDFGTSKIIQIAAVRVVKGEIVATFDKYINIDLEQNPEILTQLKESQHIHNISIEAVERGESLEQVVEDLIVFIDGAPIVAHNLSFDRTIIIKNLEAAQSWELLDRLHEISSNNEFDTLHLARHLLPGLRSYKLENLLSEFDLEGVNSHNALDDVRATSSLLSYIIEKKIEPLLPLLDDFIDEHYTHFSIFNKHWSELFKLFYKHTSTSGESYLSETLSDWLEYAANQNGWYRAMDLDFVVQKTQLKLGAWLDREGFIGNLNQLMSATSSSVTSNVSSSRKIDNLFTLREIDLIDKQRDRVVLSTIHRSKGLEFETAILPSVNDGTFPRWLPDEEDSFKRREQAEESKRLLYVGLSVSLRQPSATF